MVMQCNGYLGYRANFASLKNSLKAKVSESDHSAFNRVHHQVVAEVTKEQLSFIVLLKSDFHKFLLILAKRPKPC